MSDTRYRHNERCANLVGSMKEWEIRKQELREKYKDRKVYEREIDMIKCRCSTCDCIVNVSYYKHHIESKKHKLNVSKKLGI